MHLDDERIQRWLHHELSRSEQEATDRHVAECAACRSKLDEARAEERWTLDRLGRLDAPVPAVDVSAIARRAHARTVAAWTRRAAGIVIVAAAAGVAYTAPGSPVRAWVARLTGASQRPAAPARGSTPRSSGIALAPGARFTIRFAAPQSSGIAVVRVTDDDRVVVRAVNGSATFAADTDGLVIGNAGSTADYEIELPRAAPWIEIDLGPRGLLRKEGPQLVTDAPTDATGRHVLSLVAPR